MAGAVAAAFVGAYPMPGPLAMLAMAFAGAAAGGLVALIPALLRVNLKVDDVVSSLLHNSVVYFAIMALIEGREGPVQRLSDLAADRGFGRLPK